MVVVQVSSLKVTMLLLRIQDSMITTPTPTVVRYLLQVMNVKYSIPLSNAIVLVTTVVQSTGKVTTVLSKTSHVMITMV